MGHARRAVQAVPSPVVPDVGGERAMVEVLTKLLYASAVRRAELEVAQVANGHSDDDLAPGYPATQPDGTVNSYRVLREELDAQESRLADAYPVLMERIRELVPGA